MSFPPRGPPLVPTGMMHTGYAYAPVGMMQMQMPMMPQTTMMRTVVPTTATTVIARPKKQLVPQEIDKDDKKDEKPPVTTVFVGNISDRAPDSMVRTMLQRCGNVLSWKRVQGASGKLQAFGFCEYEEPEATLRCMRLLNEWEIGEKKLVVKVDAKTKTLLDEWQSKKKKVSGANKEDKEKETNGESSEDKKEEGEDVDDDKVVLDEFTLREDRVAKAGLDAIMREYAFELAKEPSNAKQSTEPVSDIPKVPMPPIKQKDASQLRDTGLDDLNVEADTKDLINREIRSFRNLHKDNEESDLDKEREREAERQRERERRKEEQRRRLERERAEQQRLKELERYEESQRNKVKKRESRSRSRSRSSSRGRSSRRSRSRERERERESREDTTRRDRRARDRELEEEEEAYERRKMEKKIREKEIAYQERLKNWEARERKKSREYEKERDREEERKSEESREARRLREFLEDYDDERDDPKFYKGSALERRLRERQKEKEVDARDRAKEKEELDEIRRKLQEEGHPDPDAEMEKIEREREEHLRPMLQLNDNIGAGRSPSESESEEERPASPPPPVQEREESEDESPEKYPALPNMKPTLQPVDESSQSSAHGSVDDESSRMSLGMLNEESEHSFGPSRDDSRLGFGAMKLGGGHSSTNSPTEPSGKRKKLTVGDVFNQDDDDSQDAKKRKLVPLDYGDSGEDSMTGFEGGKKNASVEEKRAKIKTLIENIPTAKDELFDFQLDWKIVDQSLMDKRIKPWVNKKIIEYIGEEEPTLTDFICQKVMAQSQPQNILNDVAMVLDEEAEVFVVKMWRLLVYETEAKKAGLVK
ncbi:RNA-binding protein 25-like [Mya arenaria]|uniref:RNA-binding protein 25-like n=1 Tax=Mya arenaria TaxID=6604 RepID=UPI0022E0CEE1|nr:RNA-binding protein 25-like [Mya arenaria]XP_052767395.1 RNA-binding protein 25-like [Mya arenaria]